MALGYDREMKVVAQGDSAKLYAFLFERDGDPITGDALASVVWVIQKPDNTRVTRTGSVLEDGSGYLQWDDTALLGNYVGVATFTMADGSKESARRDFNVFDPFEDSTQTQVEVITTSVWSRLQDCFDAEDEGPWLRDMSLNYFARERMGDFIGDAIFDINMQNPPTADSIGSFVQEDGTPVDGSFPLVVEGTLLMVIRHLMRSYTEQPLPMGAQIAYQDRRDYLQRWRQIYDIEEKQYLRWLALWKRQFLGLGYARTLVSSKAGRLMPAPMRTRNAGRGFY